MCVLVLQPLCVFRLDAFPPFFGKICSCPFLKVFYFYLWSFLFCYLHLHPYLHVHVIVHLEAPLCFFLYIPHKRIFCRFLFLSFLSFPHGLHLPFPWFTPCAQPPSAIFFWLDPNSDKNETLLPDQTGAPAWQKSWNVVQWVHFGCRPPCSSIRHFCLCSPRSEKQSNRWASGLCDQFTGKDSELWCPGKLVGPLNLIWWIQWIIDNEVQFLLFFSGPPLCEFWALTILFSFLFFLIYLSPISFLTCGLTELFWMGLCCRENVELRTGPLLWDR